MSSGDRFRLLRIAALGLFVAYPFIVFFLLERVGAGVLGLFLVVVLLVRHLPLWLKQLWLLLPAVAAMVAFLLLAPVQSELALRYYPVVVSVALLTVFAYSLLRPPAMITRFAVAAGAAQNPAVEQYTRKVTVLWCAFFIGNAVVSGLIAYDGNMRWWALYNGLLSYLLMGALLGGEWLYRRCVLGVADTSIAPTTPRILNREGEEGELHYLLVVDPGLKWFAGHFPDKPILPGVVQIDWAIALAEPLGIQRDSFRGIPRIKFTSVIEPGAELRLDLEKTDQGLRFRYSSAAGSHSQGSLRFD